MRIVIVGDGKVGFTLAEQLSKEGHDITVIDSKQALLQKLTVTLDVLTVHGNGASLKVQQQAGVDQSDLLIAATSADEVNMICCIIARKLGCKHTIARVRDPEYTEEMFFLKEELGLSMVVNPDRAAAREIFRLLQLPEFLKREPFARGRAEIVGIELEEESPLCNKKLIELPNVLQTQVLVCAVERGNEVYIPTGTFQLHCGDKIYVTAPTQKLGKLVKVLGLQMSKIHDVLLIGGSRISYYLCTMLLEDGINVKIIELDPKRCLQLADQFPKATIIQADGTDKAVLQAENIGRSDAVVTLTNIDEENLLISMYANYLEVPKVITKINRTEFYEVFRDKGIDCVVSPKLLCATDILRYVRAMQNTTGSVLTVHRLVEQRVEALEFAVTEKTDQLGRPLRDIPFKKDMLVACINRNGTIIIPQGSDFFQIGDTVVVVAVDMQHAITDLNDIFAAE